MFLFVLWKNTEMFAKLGVFVKEKAPPFLVREWGYLVS